MFVAEKVLLLLVISLTAYGFMGPHYKPTTLWWPPQFYNENPFANKTVASYWIEAQDSGPNNDHRSDMPYFHN